MSPHTGRVKVLALLHSFTQDSVYVPNKESAERLLRNEKILKLYRSGKSYSELSLQFNISERWIRKIIEIMLYNCKHR